MYKKGLLALFTLSFAFVTACSSGTGSTPGPQENTGTANKSNEQIKITWWDFQPNQAMIDALNTLIAAYEKEHPNVKIERTFVPFADIKNKLLLGSAAGQLPDIVMIDGPDHQAFASAGVLADITEEVKAWGEADKYFEAPWDATMYQGKNYGVPVSNNNLGLFYNADLLKEAGVEPPKTWDELKTAAKKLSKNGVYGLAIAAPKSEQLTFQYLPFLWQAGSDLTRIDDPGTVDTLKLYKELVDSGSMSKEVLTQDQQATFLQFMAGKAAMVLSGPWQLPALKEAKFNWGLVDLPAGKERATILGGDNWAITATSKYKDVAWDIIKFSQKPEFLKPLLVGGARIPSRQDLINDSYWQTDKYMKIFADQHKYAKARAYGPNYPKISEAIQDMVQQTVTGVKSPEDSVKEAAEKIKPLLK
ncbi:multiple sugar transport system substrate-binding protein [Paenibacillus sp. UNCCL117]|uniref:ABC transporter substrate-binding protein n=1 Tax=unclassified Paenibacillus TaxID=185978 RepID=UPI0008846185|nr:MULTISPECIES: sugar ABC transporter substrate-binding protein [unclassified Paenibacillus]SDD96318.1 carbohydrate ABC transporter substrate-binding protein, CUT1 family [Paenibacillus sp. cl123]SFW56417.1 multiple sugar transport system substrate-binding protein [Paenibacillus sp. UNCCL117]